MAEASMVGVKWTRELGQYYHDLASLTPVA